MDEWFFQKKIATVKHPNEKSGWKKNGWRNFHFHITFEFFFHCVISFHISYKIEKIGLRFFFHGMELSFRSSLLIMMMMIHFETVVRIDDYENKGEKENKKKTPHHYHYHHHYWWWWWWSNLELATTTLLLYSWPDLNIILLYLILSVCVCKWKHSRFT